MTWSPLATESTEWLLLPAWRQGRAGINALGGATACACSSVHYCPLNFELCSFISRVAGLLFLVPSVF